MCAGMPLSCAVHLCHVLHVCYAAPLCPVCCVITTHSQPQVSTDQMAVVDGLDNGVQFGPGDLKIQLQRGQPTRATCKVRQGELYRVENRLPTCFDGCLLTYLLACMPPLLTTHPSRAPCSPQTSKHTHTPFCCLTCTLSRHTHTHTHQHTICLKHSS